MIDYLDIILKIILGILALFGGKEIFNRLVIRYSKNEEHNTASVGSGEAIGRDKVVINNYHFPRVGNPDELLSSSAVPTENKADLISDALGVLVKSDNTFALTSTQIEEITTFFQNVFDADSNGRTSLSLMKGSFFALQSDPTNPEWEEHCAGSMREFLHQWKGSEGAISSAFNKVKPEDSTSFPNMTNSRSSYERLRIFYEYFSAKCHHEHDNAVRALRSLFNDQSIKHDTSDTFKKVVAMFLTDMSGMIQMTKV